MNENSKAIANTEQCNKIGEILKQTDIRPEFYKREFLNFEADRETKLKVYFLSAAICHQTHNLHNSVLNLYGWDFMEYAFIQMSKERNLILNPGYTSICKSFDIKQFLQSVFSSDGNPDNCTLDRLDERTEMLMEISTVVKKKYNGQISNLIDSSEGNIINKGNGLYEVLSEFKAFSDPLKKKITFFIKLAVDGGVLRIRDVENIIPIMDYHMQRVLLRMGCVEIKNKNLRNILLNRNRQISDAEIRNACIDAVRIIANTSGHGILKMNDFFWPLGRSCCNETTLCHDKHCTKNPCTFYSMVNISSHENCIFEKYCKGAQDENYRKMWEPIVETHYY